jgi:hypothetical protein
MHSLSKKKKIFLLLFFGMFIISMGSFYILSNPNIRLDLTRGRADNHGVDFLDFMHADYDYKQMTEMNSYLDAIIYTYNQDKAHWEYVVPFTECPPKFKNRCVGIDHHYYYGFRKKNPDENILYLSKNIHTGMNFEVFWYDDEWIWNFQEGVWILKSASQQEYCDPSEVFSCFHNFGLEDYSDNGIEYPNRGMPWAKRYFTSGSTDDYYQGIDNNMRSYKDMQIVYNHLYKNEGDQFHTQYHFPNWDSATFTIDNKPMGGDLPKGLEVVMLEYGDSRFKERYYYGRKDQNSFGMVRFDSWFKKKDYCGSQNNCCTGICDGEWVLHNYVTFNYLTHYEKEYGDPSTYFKPSFYSDPKIEVLDTGEELSNDAIPRGAFTAPASGMDSNSSNFKQGDSIWLGEILTDIDWLIADGSQGALDACPSGYYFIGSIHFDSYWDHRMKQRMGWAPFCATGNNIILSDQCPEDYKSIGYLEQLDQKDYAYSFDKRQIGDKRTYFCAHYNEKNYPKIEDNCTDFECIQKTSSVSSCTPNCSNKECGDNGCGGSCGTCSSSETCNNGLCQQSSNNPQLSTADLNQDGTVNNQDYMIFVDDYMSYRQNDQLQQQSDLNNDGKIDLNDYEIFLEEYN